ncbi:MAG: 3-phosphoserine/phosphohydroxythreonine transaminase [Bacteroidetes bacterium]|nr:3-phosphoserine/phosphohydroxythreonine transaminase [Bacteroidota bacterium]
MKKHNFNAGPSVLPRIAIENSAKAIIDLNGSGLSLLEISHRSKDFQAIIDEAVALFKELLNIPENYHILFLGFTYVPKNYTIPADADYFHITTNNTIYGSELHVDLDSPVPLVADMSSDILSRPVDVSKYAMIYGGAQKNLGPAGVTFVILREDILGKTDRPIPTMLDYRTHIKEGSMFNTPPCFAIYTCLETLKWIKGLGGVNAIQEMNRKKAQLLYDTIDASKIFIGTVEKDSRSLMNICFIMKEGYKDKEDAFMEFAKSKGMIGIKGHRSVGGFRASTYNALPIESVQALVDCMNEFEKANV